VRLRATRRRLMWAALLATCLAPAWQSWSVKPAGADDADTPGVLEVRTDPDSGLTGWYWTGQRLSVDLVQLLPDQTRAFFMGRGFDAGDADGIAQTCVFQSIMRNTASDLPLELDLARWRIHAPDGAGRLRLNSDWQAVWRARGTPEPARIAFRWALFPTEQRFEPGDWLMGMIVFDRAPGDVFDLELRWLEGDRERRRMLPGIQCAPDVRVLRPSAEGP
jgi:hypothetical protein